MRLARACGVAMVMVTLAGCSMFEKRDPNAPLIAAPHSPVADVPIPAGFEMTADSTSKIVPGNSLRFVDHHYKGSEEMQPVVRFYKDEMPKQKWVPGAQTQTSGKEVSMEFTKGKEDCIVTVTQRSFDTEVHVRIDPVGRNGGQ